MPKRDCCTHKLCADGSQPCLDGNYCGVPGCWCEVKTKTNTTEMWGLLVRPRHEKGKWRPVRWAMYIYDTQIDALKQCNEWNITSPAYIYKPVSMSLIVEWEE